GFEAPRVTVRWLSSTPMQQASLKSDGNKDLADWSKEFYVVAVSGMRMGMGGPGGGGPGGPDGQQPPQQQQRRGPGGQQQQPPGVAPDPQQRMAQMRERMKESTSLQIGSRGPMQPARVETMRGESGPVTLFLFPRVTDVAAGDKEIQFQTAMGPMTVKAKFPLKDMTVKGKIEL
ncbi:MAG: hypothetical protein SGI92_09100, partial [Bryobacteraceae bacterium]|nr:hypothetical protein [Bryobacteraceae bacterium]